MTTSLHPSDLMALSPLFILLMGGLAILLVESFGSPTIKKGIFYLSLLTLVAAGVATVMSPYTENPLLTSWLRFDASSRVLTILFLSIGLGAACLAYAFFQRFEASQGEYYFLLICSLVGLILIGLSADFLTLFLGLETLSLSSYILCGYIKKWNISHEASLKYFLIGSVAAALFLYGVALLYGATGSTRFGDLAGLYENESRILFMGGIAFVTLGLLFKATIVPFHAWAPDVYEGAPTPVTALMAVGTKAGAFVGLSILFLRSLPNFDDLWNEAVAGLACATLIYANLVALKQNKLRRFFAYSGISHAGFLLIPLVAGTPESLSALLFYIVVYSLATLGAFAILVLLDKRAEGATTEDLRGLFYRSPFLATLLTLSFLTLAGIPPTAGFFAKFYVFKQAFQAGYIFLVVVGLLTTIISVFYYLRFVTIMFSKESHSEDGLLSSWPAYFVGGASAFGLVLLSLNPNLLLWVLNPG